MRKYQKLPYELEKEPIDNWWEEERQFIFFLDAYWGERTSDFQLFQVLNREINEIIEKPVSEFMPEAIGKNFENMLKTAPNEQEKQRLIGVQEKGSVMQKKMEVDKLLDEVKKLMNSDAFAKYMKDVERLLNAKR